MVNCWKIQELVLKCMQINQIIMTYHLTLKHRIELLLAILNNQQSISNSRQLLAHYAITCPPLLVFVTVERDTLGSLLIFMTLNYWILQWIFFTQQVYLFFNDCNVVFIDRCLN